jgi:aminopeptidase N
MTILYFENKYGKDTANKMLLENRKQVVAYHKKRQQPIVDTTVRNYMELLNANSYQKGGWVLHMLRNQLGDSAFWKGIRAYYAKFSGKNAATDDLRKVMEEVSGQKLETFFKQWLYTAGQPVLDISWQYDAANKQVKLTVVQQQETAFQFPLEINLTDKDGKTQLRKTIPIKDKQTNLTIPVNGQIETIHVDPAIKLLCEYNLKPF